MSDSDRPQPLDDQTLAALYRDSAREAPPAPLDNAIREMARKKKPPARGSGWLPNRAVTGLATAAVVLMTIGVVRNIDEPRVMLDGNLEKRFELQMEAERSHAPAASNTPPMPADTSADEQTSADEHTRRSELDAPVRRIQFDLREDAASPRMSAKPHSGSGQPEIGAAQERVQAELAPLPSTPAATAAPAESAASAREPLQIEEIVVTAAKRRDADVVGPAIPPQAEDDTGARAAGFEDSASSTANVSAQMSEDRSEGTLLDADAGTLSAGLSSGVASSCPADFDFPPLSTSREQTRSQVRYVLEDVTHVLTCSDGEWVPEAEQP